MENSLARLLFLRNCLNAMATCDSVVDVSSGLPTFVLCAGSATATVFRHGAHVTSWTIKGQELLFVSKHAVFAPPKAIRGGVPLCWPQFSDFGSCKAQHGFARNSDWSLKSGGADESGHAFVELELRSSDATFALFPHAFSLRLRVALSPDGPLTMDLSATNTGGAAFSFTTALHSYFRVPDVAFAGVSGVSGTLKGCTFLDSAAGRVRVVQATPVVRFDAEVDRIYLAVPARLEVDAGAHKVQLATRALPDAVVWNPWVSKAAALPDFGDDEFKHMVCVEVAAVEHPIQLQPGATWSGGQTLTLV